MARRNVDLGFVAAFAVASALAVNATSSAIVAALPGVYLVLFAPGYALSIALLPERSRDRAERALLAVGLSISLSVAGSVALAESPAHLTASSWAVGLGALTLASSIAGAWRRRRLPPTPEGAAATGVGAASTGRKPVGRGRVPFAGIGLASVALALVAGSFVVARLPASNVKGFTILWALPRDAADGGFSVGITSDELASTSYLLKAVSGRRLVLERRVTLRPGQSWRATGSVGASSLTIPRSVEVSLSKAASPGAVYRHVHLQFGAFGV